MKLARTVADRGATGLQELTPLALHGHHLDRSMNLTPFTWAQIEGGTGYTLLTNGSVTIRTPERQSQGPQGIIRTEVDLGLEFYVPRTDTSGLDMAYARSLGDAAAAAFEPFETRDPTGSILLRHESRLGSQPMVTEGVARDGKYDVWRRGVRVAAYTRAAPVRAAA